MRSARGGSGGVPHSQVGCSVTTATQGRLRPVARRLHKNAQRRLRGLWSPRVNSEKPCITSGPFEDITMYEAAAVAV